MKQVVQSIATGKTEVIDVPAPLVPGGHVLVASSASVLSTGTERSAVNLARKNLLQKARARPDQVRRVLQKLRQEGLASTIQQVRARLAEPRPLGYAAAGVVLECGAGVQEVKPGDRVATAGPHAELVVVGHHLCARIPEGVSFEQAAYTSVGAVALEGVRLARVELGERVLVIGLGLVGQIAVSLLKAQGCRVFGTDIDESKLERARAMGADEVALGSPTAELDAFSGGHGVDAVLNTAATDSNEPIELAAVACRPKARIVLVGVAGMKVPREPFFKKELEFTVSASLGAGRWDPSYEEAGRDYPIGYARWTVQRNMQAVLEQIAEGRLPVEKLTTHRFPIDRAAEAYDLVTDGGESTVGVILDYPESARLAPRTTLHNRRASSGTLGVSVIGAGNFSRLFVLPNLKREKVELRGICSAKGVTAVTSGERSGFAFATSNAEEILADDQTNAVILLTRHNLHASMVMAALRAGKHVFVEKPLCLSLEELRDIQSCVDELGAACPILTVGFNRRFAPALRLVEGFFAGIGPRTSSFRFVAGALPVGAWPQDDSIGGGRIIGEACHAIDTCAAVAGSPPVRVFAESVAAEAGEITDDRVLITLRHGDGSISSVAYQAAGDRGGPKERLEVFGGGRTAVVEDWRRVELWREGRVQRKRSREDKGHTALLRAFLRACQTEGAAWPIAWEHLVGTTWASIMAVQSLRDGFAHAITDD